MEQNISSNNSYTTASSSALELLTFIESSFKVSKATATSAAAPLASSASSPSVEITATAALSSSVASTAMAS